LHPIHAQPYSRSMFATTAGPYPPLDGSTEEVLRATLADQIEAGLGMVSDGRVWLLEDDGAVDDAVSGWQRATAMAAQVASGIEDGAVPAVKACLVGPLSTPGDTTAALVRLRSAILALHAAGAPVVQVDEPWAVTPDAATAAGRERAATTWARLLEGVAGHVTLALPGGGATALGAEVLLAAPFASHLVDLIRGPDDWRPLAQLPGERGAILGVADLRTARPDAKEILVYAARFAASMHGRGLARVALAPCGGLERVPRAVARAKLAGLAEAAALATLSPDELARHVDPRSIDARSAALGRWEPRQGPRRGSPHG